jgi:enamine deaminase RidA (YjgF/YER057c/UK114 family)
MTPSEKLTSLGFQLPPAPSALGIYKPALTVGNLCYTSGHLPVLPDGELMKGCVGRDVDQEFGFKAAQQAGLTILSTLNEYLGSIDKVVRVVKLLGLVYCDDKFTQQPAVVNGCSELMRDVFGEDVGIGTRSAVGVAALPLGVTVEIEGIFEIAQ